MVWRSAVTLAHPAILGASPCRTFRMFRTLNDFGRRTLEWSRHHGLGVEVDPSRQLGAKRNNAKKGSSVVVGGNGWDGLVQLFAQNQRLFPAGDDLAEVIRLTRLHLDAAIAAKAGA